ncbi:hypothetical protein DL95DRAFT_481916, partial [Leptodontidium sp. 2 PMI_412]
YLGIPRSVINPVCTTSVRLRFSEPTVNDILNRTKTELDEAIVAALIVAALRLLPIENTPQGIALRKEQQCIKAARSQRSADTFCEELSRLGHVFLREAQQGEQALTLRFQKPT